jgi:hypothetical protein
MSERTEKELTMLRECWTDLDYREDGLWVRIPAYPVPDGLWDVPEIEVCFQIPEQLPGQAPYGFYARPELRLRTGNAQPQNYEFPVGTPFGEGWGKFSWQVEPWRQTADPLAGSNMVNFVRSFADRLRQGA